MAPQVVSPQKRFWMSMMLDAYGELLTEKQNRFMRQYYEDDFTFGEIAEEFNVSRQAIFDSVKHGEAALENYERVLGVVAAKQSDPTEDQEPDSASDLGIEIRKIASGLKTAVDESQAKKIEKQLMDIASKIETLNLETKRTTRKKPPAQPVFIRGEGPEVD